MVSVQRMRTDVVAQVLLAIAAGGCLLLGLPGGFYSLLALLWLWQVLSALQLRYGYHRPLRRHFLWFAATQVLVLVLLVWFLPQVVIALLCASGLFYLCRSLRDWQIVARRPVSFWDLK